MLIDIIATLLILGGHLVVCLPNPQGSLTIAVMCDGIYTLSFEVGVVNFVSTFKQIKDLSA